MSDIKISLESSIIERLIEKLRLMGIDVRPHMLIAQNPKEFFLLQEHRRRRCESMKEKAATALEQKNAPSKTFAS